MNPADQHEDSSHNGSSGFGDNADSAEMADLGRVAHWRAARLGPSRRPLPASPHFV